MTTLKETIESMRKIAYKFDQLGYQARNVGIDYKAKEYFEAAILLRNAADKTEYVLS